jgi:hypothetical protein
MSFELTMLAASCVLCLVQLLSPPTQPVCSEVIAGRPALVTPKSHRSRVQQVAWKEHLETSLRHSRFSWLRSSLFTCSAMRASSANGVRVSISRPGWFTFCATRRAFPCSDRWSGTSHSLELLSFCSRRCGAYSARFNRRVEAAASETTR